MKLTDKIHLVQIDFEIAVTPDKKIPRFVNVLIIFGDKITLIDTGVKGSEKFIFEYIQEQYRDASEIERIILSHSHPDHIGSAAKIKELTNCKVCAHELEKRWIEDIELQNQQRPVPGFFKLVGKPVLVDELLKDNQIVKIQDGLTLKCLKSSGHSKGLLNIQFIEDKMLFTADSIPLTNDIPNYDNYLELMESLEQIKSNSGYETLLTSWTPPLTGKNKIDELIQEGEEYMIKIDSAVKENYQDKNTDSLENCKKTIENLGLLPFLINPIVDNAFKSHLK